MNNQQPMMNNRPPMYYQPPQQQNRNQKSSGGNPFMAILMLALIGGLIYVALNFEQVMSYIENREEASETTNTDNTEKKENNKKDDNKKDDNKKDDKKEEPTPVTPTPTPVPTPTPEPTPGNKEGDNKEDDPSKVEPVEPKEDIITTILSLLPFDQVFANNTENIEDGYSGPNDKDTTFYMTPYVGNVKIDAYLTFNVVRSNDVASKYLKWTSSDKNIATVDDNGKVKGLKAGVVTITAEMDNGMKTSSQLHVINAGLSMSASSTLKLDSKPISISVDEEYSGKVKFVSSNPKIASVDDKGKVTPHRTGTVTITGTVDNLKNSVNITVTGNRMHFINTHEVGDAILLESNGKFALIDTGPTNWDTSRKYFFEYLDSLDIKDVGLEFVILTNQHYEHNGGMISLLNKGYPVKKIYMKSYNGKDDHTEQIADRYNKIVETASEYKVQVVYVDKDNKFKEEISKSGTIDLEDMRIYFFNTLQRMANANRGTFDYYKSNYYSGSNESVNSIVNLVYVNGHNVLLGSDLNDYDIFNGIMKNKVKMVWNRNEKIDVYKINNHASYDCAGNKKYTVNASNYVVTNGIDQEYTNGRGNGYYISNDKVVYNSDEKTSCFNDLGVDMCDAYYTNNSDGAIIVDLGKDVKVSGKLGKEVSKRCPKDTK